MQDLVARGGTGTGRAYAKGKGSYISRALFLQEPPCLRELPISVYALKCSRFNASEPFPRPHTLAFDHIYPTPALASVPHRELPSSTLLSNLPISGSCIH